MRGSGRQNIGVAINFIAFCCLGLSLGVTLTFFVFHEAFGESKYYQLILFPLVGFTHIASRLIV